MMICDEIFYQILSEQYFIQNVLFNAYFCIYTERKRILVYIVFKKNI